MWCQLGPRLMVTAVLGACVWMGCAATALAQHKDVGEEKLTNERCLGCHDGVQEKMGTTPHKAIESGCVTCHDIKEGTATPFLRAEEGALCKACHHLPALPQGARPPEQVEIARGISVPASALPRVKQLSLDPRGVGHPVTNHPVSGVPDPLRKGKSLSCVSCHAPHGGGGPKMLAFTLKPGEGICQHCHKL
jgi:predicted CXXCH cytochrome family protein